MFMEMYLPIFPLNTVLFPGTTLELQIFEERYKKMIYSALTTNQDIGIFCIKEGIEAYGPLPTPYEIGTLGKIYEHDPIQNLFQNDVIFRINIMGLKKIKLLHYYESQDHYLVGNAIIQEENIFSQNITTEKKNEFLKEVKEYLKYQNIDNVDQLTTDNFILLCHLAIKYLNISLSEKQKLLQLSSFEERWKETFKTLKQKNEIIKQLQNVQEHRKDDYDMYN